MKLSKNSEGFELISILLIVVLVGIIAGTGWFVYNSKKAVTKTVSTPSYSTTDSKQAKSNTKKSVITTTYSKAPKALQTVIAAKDANCFKDGKFATAGGDYVDADVLYIPETAAFVNLCDHYEIYSYTAGNWSYDLGGQMEPYCADLVKFKIPAALITAVNKGTTAQCTDEKTQALKTYTD